MKSLLRFCVCGSVDNGKSTLIGRLLYDEQLLHLDQLRSLEAESASGRMSGGELDFSLLLDGLSAEREQGITIDVAYRYFATAVRRFIVIDAPGHEQYTRNMATGASNAELAVILADISGGEALSRQTLRHTYICAMLGIRKIALVVNKMDRVEFSATAFQAVETAYADFCRKLGIADIQAIPTVASRGDNVARKSEAMPWYRGPSLLAHLEQAEIVPAAADKPFRMPVQLVSRLDGERRGLSGMIAAGSVKTGDEVRILPAMTASRIGRVAGLADGASSGVAGQCVTLELETPVDAGRGDVIAAAEAPPEVADQFNTQLLWLGEEPLLPGRSYLFRSGTATRRAAITSIRYAVNTSTLEKVPAQTLRMNEIARCNLALDTRIAFEAFAENRDLGSFILIDRFSNQTVGMGVIDYALRRSNNISTQNFEISRTAREAQKKQKAGILWFTGLSGSGKSTTANAVDMQLFAKGHHTYVLDGDNIRGGLNRDLGFADADRVENVRRIAEVARLMADAGLLVLVCSISPFQSERAMVRELTHGVEFVEIYLSTPIEVCERRDSKGLYKKARAGALKNFTGIDSRYEAPARPDIDIDASKATIAESADAVMQYLQSKGIIA